MAAAQCRSDLRPASLAKFDAGNNVNDTACLESLRAQAKAVGWTSFPLFEAGKTAVLNSGGYTLGGTGYSGPSAAVSAPAQMDRQLWGDGWIRLDGNLNGFSGLMMRSNWDVVLASDTMQGKDLIDYLVYTVAKENLTASNIVVQLTDKTDEARRYYADRRDELKAEIAADAGRSHERHLRDSGGSERNIRLLEQEIAEKEREIAQARAETAPERDFSEMEAMMKAFPNSGFDIEEFKKSAKAMSNNTQNELIGLLEIRLSEKRASLAAARQAAGSAPAAAAELYKHAVSLDQDGASRGRMRALETYKYVYVFDADISYSCNFAALVCADKLQAYNALGSKVEGPAFTPISEPTGYVAFRR